MLVDKQKTSVDAVQYEDFTPIRIVEIELGQPLSTVQALDEKAGQNYRRARCLVRPHDQPRSRYTNVCWAVVPSSNTGDTDFASSVRLCKSLRTYS
jgi:hypothetical protein